MICSHLASLCEDIICTFALAFAPLGAKVVSVFTHTDAGLEESLQVRFDRRAYRVDHLGFKVREHGIETLDATFTFFHCGFCIVEEKLITSLRLRADL